MTNRRPNLASPNIYQMSSVQIGVPARSCTMLDSIVDQVVVAARLVSNLHAARHVGASSTSLLRHICASFPFKDYKFIKHNSIG